MTYLRRFALALLCASLFLCSPAFADSYNAGYISYDTTTGSTAAFDIGNLTGPNNSGDNSFPITTPVSLSSLKLVVAFLSGGSETFGSSYFTLSADGLSFDGAQESTTTGQPGGFMGAISATLTGSFDTTTVTLTDGSTVTIDPSFSATVIDPSGLANGDAALIEADAGGMPPPSSVAPEPESLMFVGTGLAVIAALRRRNSRVLLISKALTSSPILAIAAACVLSSTASAATTKAIKLTGAASPGSGLAGVTTVHVTATGLPSGSLSASGVTVSVAGSCMGSATSASVTSITSLPGGTGTLIYFQIPSSLASGSYQVSVTGTAGSTTFASSNCSLLTVTASTPSLASCVPTSSIAVTVGSDVIAYVPYGYWEGSKAGLAAVGIEGSVAGTSTIIQTPGVVNSCAANSASTPAEIICTENSANVDRITGVTLNSTVTSATDQYAAFSGGECRNCGVAVDAANNRAVIGMGLSKGGGSGLQSLDLGSNTFDTAFPLAHYVSEDISIDPTKKWILSPGEDNVFNLLTVDTTGGKYALKEFGNYIGGPGELDSAAEDCTTGIALASSEESDSIYITDLSQISFTAGSPGTWTAPGQFLDLSDGGYSAGTCGITSAPGTAHLAAVTGEFGGASYAILQLPSASGPGKGTPNLVDYAYVSSLPNTPDGIPFSAGFDPHTITAYTSPNGAQKSYVLMVDYGNVGYPTYVAQVDMSCVLAAHRSGGAGSHTVSPSSSGGRTAADGCVKYFSVPKPS